AFLFCPNSHYSGKKTDYQTNKQKKTNIKRDVCLHSETCEASHFRRVWQSERDDVSKLIQMTKYQHNKTGDDTELIETTYHHPFVSCREKEILSD
ncbi:hypothetical protein, partial [Streptococcus suis]|uniref:hypothetical protein n=1 Tax=Streptococcus suis TaxID=1307 RepID=UPI001EE05653